MFGGGTSTLSMAGQAVISGNNRYVPQDSMKFLLSNSAAPIPNQTTSLQRRQAAGGGGSSSYSDYLSSQNAGGKTEYAKMLDAQIVQKKQLEAANNQRSLPSRLQKNSATSKSVMQFGSNYDNAFNPNNELQRTMPQNSLAMSINQPTGNNYSLFGGMTNNLSSYVPTLLIPARPSNQSAQQQQQPDRETFFDKWQSEGDKTYTTRPQQYRGLLRKENMGEVQFSEKERKQQELSQALLEQMLYKKQKEEMEQRQRKFEDLEFLKRLNEQRNNSKDQSRVQTSTNEQQRINTVVSKAEKIQQRNIVSRRQENAQNAGPFAEARVSSSTALAVNNPNFDGSKELPRTPSKMQRKIVVQEQQHFRIEKIVDVPLTSRVGTENRLDNSFLPENYNQNEKSMNRMSVNNSRVMDLEDEGRNNNGKNREYQQQLISQQQSYSQIQQLEQGKKNQIDMDYISDYYEFQKKVFNREMAALKKEMNDGKFSVNKASKRDNVRAPTNLVDDTRAILGIKTSKRNSQILDSEVNPYLRDLGLEKKQQQSAMQAQATGYGQPVQQSQPAQQLLVFHSELIPNNSLEKYTRKVQETSGEEFEDVEKNLDEMKVALEAIEELRNRRRSQSMGHLEKANEKAIMLQELASELLNNLAKDRDRMFEEQEGKGKKGQSQNKSKKQKKAHKHKFKVDDDISERDEEEEEDDDDDDDDDRFDNKQEDSDDQNNEDEEKSMLKDLASSFLETLAHDREEYFEKLEKGENPNLDEIHQSHNEFLGQLPTKKHQKKVIYRSKSIGMKVDKQEQASFEKIFLKGKKIAFIIAREEKLTVEEYLWEKTSENSLHEDDDEMIQAKECLLEIEKIINKQNEVFGMGAAGGKQNVMTMKEFETRRKNRIDLKGRQLADEHLQLLMREQEKEALRKQGASLEEIARVDKKYNLSNSNRHLAKLYVRAYNTSKEEGGKNKKNNKINESNSNQLSYAQYGRNGLKKSNDFDNKPMIIATSQKQQSITPKYAPIMFQNKLAQKTLDHSKPLLQQTQQQSTKQQQLESLDLPSKDIVYEEDDGERSNKSAASRMDEADEIAEIRQQMRLYEYEGDDNDNAAAELQDEYQQILASDREHKKKLNEEDEFEFEKNLNNLDKMIANFATKQPVNRSRAPSGQPAAY